MILILVVLCTYLIYNNDILEGFNGAPSLDLVYSKVDDDEAWSIFKNSDIIGHDILIFNSDTYNLQNYNNNKKDNTSIYQLNAIKEKVIADGGDSFNIINVGGNNIWVKRLRSYNVRPLGGMNFFIFNKIHYLYKNGNINERWQLYPSCAFYIDGNDETYGPNNRINMIDLPENVPYETVIAKVKEDTIDNYGTINEQYIGFGNLYLTAEQLQGCVDNFSDTVADVGDIYEVVVAQDDATWAVDARADNTNNSINLYVTGAANKTVRWTAMVKTIEVTQ
jgi:hypothetical protein